MPCTFPACSCRATGVYCKDKPQKKKPSRIKPVSDKGKEKKIVKGSLVKTDMVMYIEIWQERSHKCECCGSPIYFMNIQLFHHILPKRPDGGYPEYRHAKWNIALLCKGCHNAWEENPDNRQVITDAMNVLLAMHEKGELDPESDLLIINWHYDGTFSLYTNAADNSLF